MVRVGAPCGPLTPSGSPPAGSDQLPDRAAPMASGQPPPSLGDRLLVHTTWIDNASGRRMVRCHLENSPDARVEMTFVWVATETESTRGGPPTVLPAPAEAPAAPSGPPLRPESPPSASGGSASGYLGGPAPPTAPPMPAVDVWDWAAMEAQAPESPASAVVAGYRMRADPTRPCPTATVWDTPAPGPRGVGGRGPRLGLAGATVAVNAEDPRWEMGSGQAAVAWYQRYGSSRECRYYAIWGVPVNAPDLIGVHAGVEDSAYSEILRMCGGMDGIRWRRVWTMEEALGLYRVHSNRPGVPDRARFFGW